MRSGPKGIDWDAVADLATARADVIAAREGCTTQAVTHQRRKRSIAPPPGARGFNGPRVVRGAVMITRLPRPRKPGQPVTLDWLRANSTTLGDCWLWRGAVNTHGYASVKVDGRTVCGHVLAYTLAHGPIAPGMERDHRCGQRRCVNPAHLEPVTHAENVRRGRSHVYRDGVCPRCGCTRLYVPKPGNTHSRRCARCTNETRKRREGRA